jgi:flagellar hook-associated protein 2
MQGITISGLGSGLDTSSIISQLVALERIPIQQIEDQRQTDQTKLSYIGTFKGLLRDLQTQAKDLSKATGFGVFNVTAGIEGVASFGATSSATAGTHTLAVNQLAAVDRWAFDGVADPTASLAASDGTVSFSVGGNDYTVDVPAAASSLEDVAAAINTAAGADVSATIVNTGTTSAPSHQLVLTSKHSGEDYRITGIASTVSGLAIDPTGPDAGGTAQSASNITVGLNAIAVIDGLTVERESNDLGDVIQGVDITLQSLTASPISFSVETNTTAIKSKLKDFVQAYNDVISFVNTQNTYNKDTGTGGPLFGDSLLRSARNEISGALFGFQYRQDTTLQNVIDDTQGYTTLSVVGIKVANDGTLSIDDAVLDDKLASNVDAFANLFADTDGFDNGGAQPNTPAYYQDTTADAGLAAILDRAIGRMFDTFDDGQGNVRKGLLDSRTDALQSSIDRYNKQIDDKEVRLEKFQEDLVQRFATLEQVMGGLNAQGAALNAALLNLQ